MDVALVEIESADAVMARARAFLRPPPRRPISEWANDKFVLSAESSAEAGKWTCMPFQVGILDAFSDPRITYVSVIKSARVGWTKMINIVVGRHMDEDPCGIMVVQPTINDAKGFSKEEIAPMLRDVPALKGKVKDARGPGSDNEDTILSKRFPGGILSFAGANSGTGFRRIARRIALADEIDAYPPSAGDDGDQYRLMEKRTQWYWDRKIGAGSTPLVHGVSRIEKLFIAGDQRRFYVPCPHCGHKDHLVFQRKSLTERDDDQDGMVFTSPGHFMAWDTGKPETAHFVCSGCGACIEEAHKTWMVDRGEWIAARPTTDHASFHVWAAYSYAPNATWGQIAKEFLAATKEGTDTLRTFVNTVLGETWRERGEAPEWERLYRRRESYAIGSVPRNALFLTAGVDVQRDRLEYEVIGWGRGRESWSIDQGRLVGDTSDLTSAAWTALNALLARVYRNEDGYEFPIWSMAVDSGDQTQVVYNWCRQFQIPRVLAIKGMESKGVLVGNASVVDVQLDGRKVEGGYRVFPVSGSIAKSEFYGFLRLQAPSPDAIEHGALFPQGYCHFPEYGEDFFKQLTAEQLVTRRNKRGFLVQEWELIPGRQNHALDCRVYARAAAQVMGLDRFLESDWQQLEARIGRTVAASVVTPVVATTVTPESATTAAPVVHRAEPARPAAAPAPSFLDARPGFLQRW